MRTKIILSVLLVVVLLPLSVISCQNDEVLVVEIPVMPHEVPIQGNSWFFTKVGNEIQTADVKRFNWSTNSSVLRTYFRVETSGEIHIGIKAKVSEGNSKLKATFQNESTEISVSNTTNELIYVGSYSVSSPGYYYLDIQGIEKQASTFATIQSVQLGGEATQKGIRFSNKDFFYWGRRGPSVHLGYQVPEAASDVVWMYSEITVPSDNDVIGSYYMANGFGQGYFGMQVNSSTERRVLFSVWSPFVTDDPSKIPEDQRVKLLAKGEHTITNDFGNEGSGGQSFMRMNWKAENAYGFLLKGEPSSENTTDYSAYFYDKSENKWYFIATWRRPKIKTYLTGLYSFLENFDTKTGPIMRQALYNNQWVYDTNGKWHEITKAKFTADATARAKARLDYAGGSVKGNKGFYLKNCGFFSETSDLDIMHERDAFGKIPEIDFSTLPKK